MIRTIIVLFLCMIFCHIVDDYYLQGWLSSAKQKDWWVKNAPQKLYKNDYVVALICHALSWAFMIMLPLAIVSKWYVSCPWFLLSYPINVAIHAITDDLKANKHKINLITDQLIHLCQIALTLFAFYLFN